MEKGKLVIKDNLRFILYILIVTKIGLEFQRLEFNAHQGHEICII